MLVITDGNRYVCYGKNDCINFTTEVSEASEFPTPNKAIKQMQDAPVKTKNCFVYDTETVKIVWRWLPSQWAKVIEAKQIEKQDVQPTEKESTKVKRISFTPAQRSEIYRKTEGHCYLCGDFVDFTAFEVEHKLPLALGGTNDMENLFCSCHDCNSMKGSIAPTDLMQKMKQILLYQAEGNSKRGKKSLKWKLINKLIVLG